LEQFVICGKPAQNEWTEQNTGQDFADHTGLAQTSEQMSEQMGRGEDDREKQNQWSNSASWHQGSDYRAACSHMRWKGEQKMLLRANLERTILELPTSTKLLCAAHIHSAWRESA
jgi:hypothetical protein